VAQDQGLADREVADRTAVVVVQVGATDAAERDSDPHLVGREGAVPDPVDAEVLLPVTNGCKHGARCPAVS